MHVFVPRLHRAGMATVDNTEHVESNVSAADGSESLEPDNLTVDDSALGSDVESTASASLTSSIVR